MSEVPTAGDLTALDVESELLAAGHRYVVGMDEVGRGALAGPVTVGAAWFDLAELVTADVPGGIRDSKLLSRPARVSAAEAIRTFAPAVSVGMCQPAEIDQLGMTLSLCLAGRRALAALPAVDVVLLDGNLDWLDRPLTLDCLDVFGSATRTAVPPVHLFVKGDARIVSIAASSVVAKVERDTLMTDLGNEFPDYRWHTNAGYGTAEHRAAIRRFGPSIHHRTSFKLL